MRIVVLAGGISTERDVSLSSGAMIYRALKERGHQAVLLDVYLGYRWEEEAFPDVSEGERPGAVFGLKKDWAKEMGKIEEKNPDIEKIKALRPDGAKNFFGPNVIPICQAADVCFWHSTGKTGRMGRYRPALT